MPSRNSDVQSSANLLSGYSRLGPEPAHGRPDRVAHQPVDDPRLKIGPERALRHAVVEHLQPGLPNLCRCRGQVAEALELREVVDVRLVDLRGVRVRLDDAKALRDEVAQLACAGQQGVRSPAGRRRPDPSGMARGSRPPSLLWSRNGGRGSPTRCRPHRRSRGPSWRLRPCARKAPRRRPGSDRACPQALGSCPATSPLAGLAGCVGRWLLARRRERR